MSPSPPSPIHRIGPKGSIGSAVNVVMCAALAVIAIVVGTVQAQPFFLAVTAVAVLMEIQFVRTFLRVRRQTRIVRESSADEPDASHTAGH